MDKALKVLKWTAKLAILPFLVACVLFIGFHFIGFLHVVGVMPRTPSTAYNFWSGFGSDIGEYTIALSLFGNLAHSYRKHNCREDKCRRVGLHDYVDQHGQHHPACKKHHPHMGEGHRFSFRTLHEAHLAAKADNG